MKTKRLEIYTLYDSRDSSDKFRPRYVGKSERSLQIRLDEHLKKAHEKREDGTFVSHLHVSNWIRKVSSSGGEIEMRSWCSCLDKQELLLQEKRLIAELREADHDLTNMTAGGDGMSDPCHETRQKMSEAKRGTRHPNFGKKRDPSVGRKISAKISGSNNYQFGRPAHPNVLLARSRPVVCLNDGRQHRSISAAARFYDVDACTVGRSCREEIKASRNGLRFAYVIGMLKSSPSSI